MQSRETRSKAVAWGLAMTVNTPIAPDEHERELLAAFVEGVLTLDEVLAQLDERARPAEGEMESEKAEWNLRAEAALTRPGLLRRRTSQE